MNQSVDDLHKGLKLATWDIESTGLNADFGYVLCVCVYDVQTRQVRTVRIDDPRNPDPNSDKWVVDEAIKLLNEYELLVGWYSSKFDRNFLNSRAVMHNLRPNRRTGTFFTTEYWRDLWYTSKFRLKLRSNRLAVVSDFLFGKTIKNAITPDVWNGAIRGEKKALDYVVHHCELDVKETFRVYKRLMPLISKRLRKS